MEGLLNLDLLSEEETNTILSVLKRDDLVRKAEDRKIRSVHHFETVRVFVKIISIPDEELFSEMAF